MREIQPFTVWSLAASYLGLPKTSDMPENLPNDVKPETERLVRVWAERLVEASTRKIKAYIEEQSKSTWRITSAFTTWKSNLGQYLMGKTAELSDSSLTRLHSVILSSEVFSYSPSVMAFPENIDYCLSQDELLYCCAVTQYPKMSLTTLNKALPQALGVGESCITGDEKYRKQIIESFNNALNQRVFHRIYSFAAEKRRTVLRLGPQDWGWNSAWSPFDLMMKRAGSIYKMQTSSVIAYSMLYGIHLDAMLCMCPALYPYGKLYFYHAEDRCYRQLPDSFRTHLIDYQSLSDEGQKIALSSFLQAGMKLDLNEFARTDFPD